MHNSPKRLSILAQTVEILRQGIIEARWLKVLPQERLLCEELDVSRSTIRRALKQIEQLGFIAPAQRGTRRQISHKITEVSKTNVSPTPQHEIEKSVIWLTVDDISSLTSTIKNLYILVQKRLEVVNCKLRIITLPHKPLSNPSRYLKEWIKDFSCSAWILHSMPRNVQTWFSKHQRNAYLFGNPAKNVSLGGININNSSAISHAVSMFRRLHHKNICLLRRKEDLVGELDIENTFLASLDPTEKANSTVLKAEHERSDLDRIFKRTFHTRQINRPTVIFCTQPALLIFALTWLQQHQIKIPDQVSLCLLRSQKLLNHITPSLAHYEINEDRIAPAALPALLDLIETGACSSQVISLIPDFIPGQSLGEAPQD